MKLFLMLCLFFSTLSFANNPKMGFHAGLTNSFFSIDPKPAAEDEIDSGLSLDLGASFLYEMGQHGFLGEIAYTIYKGNNPDEASSESIKFSYLEIRPNYNFNISPQFFLSAGLNLGIHLNTKFCDSSSCEDLDDSDADVKGIRAGVNAGLGAKLNLGTITLLPKISYDLGLSNSIDSFGTLKVSALRFTIASLF